MNHEMVSGIINSLPIDRMISEPLTAAIKAQAEMSLGMAKFIESVGIDGDGNIRMVTFKYDEVMEDPKDPQKTISTTRYIQAPFLAMTGIPNLAVESVNIDFELEVKTAEDEKSSTAADVKSETEGKYSSWWSPVSVSTKFTGSVSNTRETTRHTDTRAKYSFNVTARKQAPPEAFMRIVDAITNSAARPTSQEKTSNLLTEGGEGGTKKTPVKKASS
ncbi:MAG: DUF2589 domain-containing protein [Chitinispirillia bacterium]|nr:DUF2589 domain-containing protein [Chitinispirillia bacterium]